MKSTADEIRQRFDADVERFSNLDTGQSATVDAPLAMALVAQAAAVATPQARHVLDVGCGAGNYTLKLLERLPNLDATLIDLSQPMLDRAREDSVSSSAFLNSYQRLGFPLRLSAAQGGVIVDDVQFTGPA